VRRKWIDAWISENGELEEEDGRRIAVKAEELQDKVFGDL